MRNFFAGLYWEQRKIKEVTKINPTSKLPSKFKYVDLNSVKGTMLLKTRNEEVQTAPSRAQRLAQKDDIFYQAVRPYQKNNFLFNLDTNASYVFSTGYAQLRSFISPYYLFSFLQKQSFVNAVLVRCTGTSYPAINATDLGDISLYCSSSRNEQGKIGKLFKLIDKFIVLQQRKISQLLLIKRFLLQNVFTDKAIVPDLRFKNFINEWEKQKFYNLLDKKNGIRRGPFGSSLKKSSFVKDSNFVVYEQNNAIKNTFKTRYNISKKKYDELHSFHLKPKDFIMSGAGTIGKIARVPQNIAPGVFNQALIRIRINNNIDSDYFLQLMRSPQMQRRLTKGNPGSAIENLVPIREIKNWNIVIPSKKEQGYISDILSEIDRIIFLQRKTSRKIVNFKQFLLQNMFI